ncbi:MAG TPA: sigma-70 family RNA polymerase sigma factor [Terriglobales bacterium]|nr:sigma-70 family RNA polymerase sigma factor [Terriglobales bacterium]
MLNTSKATRYSSLSLKDVVCLCAGPDEEAWAEFVSRVGRPLRLVIARTASIWGDPSRATVDDLVQATYLKLWEGGRNLLREFAIERPDAILGYLKKTAANATHDYFKHGRSQSAGGAAEHISTYDIEPEARQGSEGSEQTIALDILLSEIDEHLRSQSGPDADRDRTIFWLYFRQGLSSKEIASLPGIGLGTKGVGSVIERLKHSIRERILGADGPVEPDWSEKAKPFQNSY